MTYNEHINVALAVAMPDGGLITPVIKDADSTDIYQISRNWADLARPPSPPFADLVCLLQHLAIILVWGIYVYFLTSSLQLYVSCTTNHLLQLLLMHTVASQCS